MPAFANDYGHSDSAVSHQSDNLNLMKRVKEELKNNEWQLMCTYLDEYISKVLLTENNQEV